MTTATVTENVDIATDETTETEATVNTISVEALEFKANVDKLIDANVTAFADKDSETVTDIRRAFGALDKDAKRNVRQFIKDAIAVLLTEQAEVAADLANNPERATELVDIAKRAAAYNSVKDFGLKPLAAQSTGERATRKPADPALAVGKNIAQVQLAYAVAMASVPTNVDPARITEITGELVTEAAQTEALEYRAWIYGGMEGAEPEASDVAKAAARISLGRGPKGQGRKPKTADVPESDAESADTDDQ
ncbi:hypothetical protein GMA3_91 [Gordonia phage GMA3]|uniref:Uncharacterized protein n=1 Tax=Gordonia phage GMA3 TaxID=1647284 RepID=A0A0K0NL12_9CAUD|nr:hypothetical protein AU105_gp091 [Gordonia phage GMA3]AKL88268.1 hypothetical protein GMA3_91 [Gordonia phage GMA3]